MQLIQSGHRIQDARHINALDTAAVGARLQSIIDFFRRFALYSQQARQHFQSNCCASHSHAAQLTKNLRHYELLHAERDVQHTVVKRGARHSSHPFNVIKEVRFHALGRHFRLILHPHRHVLHGHFRAYNVDSDGRESIVHVDHDSHYGGRVYGELESSVRAHIDGENGAEGGGLMTATIVLPTETYHIEPSWRHLPDSETGHMIVYRGSDIKLSWLDSEQSKAVGPKTCGYVKEGLELETDEDDAEEDGVDEDDDGDNDVDVVVMAATNADYDAERRPNVRAQSHWLNRTDRMDGLLQLHQPQQQQQQTLASNDSAERKLEPRRRKRQADQYEYTPTKTRCPLLLVADYRFFQEMGGGNTKTTINYLVRIIQ